MDAKDDHILRVLERDGRISNIELADRVGLSPSACLRRGTGIKSAGGGWGGTDIQKRKRVGWGKRGELGGGPII